MNKRTIGITKEVNNMKIGSYGLSFSFKDNQISVFENGKIVHLQKCKVNDILEIEYQGDCLEAVYPAEVPTEWFQLIDWLLHISKNHKINECVQYLNKRDEYMMSYSYYENITDEEEKDQLDMILRSNTGTTYKDTELIEASSCNGNIRMLVRKKKAISSSTILAVYISTPGRAELYDFMKHISPVSYLPYGIYTYLFSEENRYSNEPSNDKD